MKRTECVYWLEPEQIGSLQCYMDELVEKKFEETVVAIKDGHAGLAGIKAERLTGMARVLEAIKHPPQTMVEIEP